jgi:hypothetical protein
MPIDHRGHDTATEAAERRIEHYLPLPLVALIALAIIGVVVALLVR